MPLLGFTVMRDVVENGAKRQTIRLARKRPIKVGDTLYLYWKLRTKECERIGVAICTNTGRHRWATIKDDEETALADGFASVTDFRAWFWKRYHPSDSAEFDIIRWDYPFVEKGKK